MIYSKHVYVSNNKEFGFQSEFELGNIMDSNNELKLS